MKYIKSFGMIRTSHLKNYNNMIDNLITLLTSNCIDSFGVGIELARSLVTDNVDKLEVIRKVNKHFTNKECPEGACEVSFLDDSIDRMRRLERLFDNWIK